MPQSKRPAAVSKKPAGVSKQKAGKPKCLSCRELRERARVAEAEMVNLMDDKVALRDRCNWLLTVIHTSGFFIDGGKLRRGLRKKEVSRNLRFRYFSIFATFFVNETCFC